MNKNGNYIGQCFCGDVKFTISGEPEDMAYCHCNSCRRWSAGPVNAFTLWKPDTIKVFKGLNNIGSFNKNPGTNYVSIDSVRKWCKTCGGHIFTEHPGMEQTDVPSAVINNFDFKPAFHVHYQETVQPMKDGLPKFKDMPAEAGGTGEELTE